MSTAKPPLSAGAPGASDPAPVALARAKINELAGLLERHAPEGERKTFARMQLDMAGMIVVKTLARGDG